MNATPSAPATSAAPAKSIYLSLLELAVPPALNYAQNYIQKRLTQENVVGLLENLPDSLGKTGSGALASFRKLSTVEKVAGGLLLALFVRHFLRGDRD